MKKNNNNNNNKIMKKNNNKNKNKKKEKMIKTKINLLVHGSEPQTSSPQIQVAVQANNYKNEQKERKKKK